MKIKFLLSLLISLSIGRAQITFPAPGAKWHYAEHSFSSANIYNEQIIYTNDTIVAGRPCRVLNGTHFFALCGSSGLSYVYTGNDSVYFYNSNTQNQWQLLYSFATPAGQSWQIRLQDMNGIDTIDVKIDSVKFTVINALSLKTLYVNYTEKYHSNGVTNTVSYPSVIYDRIGDRSYLMNFMPDISGICDDGGRNLLCYEDSLMGIYQSDTLPCNYTNVGVKELHPAEQIQIYPNPANDLITLRANTALGKTILYNLLGKEVYCSHTSQNNLQIDLSNFPEGVYFLETSPVIGVKKIIVQR